MNEYHCNFEKTLLDNTKSIATDFKTDSHVMLIAFGGLYNEVGIPPFEFFKMASDFPVKKLFLRDIRQGWYQKGLPNIGDSVDDVANYLRTVIKQQNVEKVVMTGNSAGGFASLLFGQLVKADEVISFAPQTFINPVKCFLKRDYRWLKKSFQIFYHQRNKEYLDTKLLFKTQANLNNKTIFNIYFDRSDRLDNCHAIRLQNCKNVRLHGFSEGGHQLVKLLRARGELKEILVRALQIKS